jgi:hypothetical protein
VSPWVKSIEAIPSNATVNSLVLQLDAIYDLKRDDIDGHEDSMLVL